MNPKEFVELAEKILGDKKKYEDELCIIQRNYNGLKLQITRKEMPTVAEHLRCTNLVTMVWWNGEIIRHHGEHIYLVKHFEKLSQIVGE